MVVQCGRGVCPGGGRQRKPVLRKRVKAWPEFLEDFFRFSAEEVRELLA